MMIVPGNAATTEISHPAPPRPQGAVLRAQLVDGFDWHPIEDVASFTEIRRRTYRLTAIARRQRRVARLFEWPGHGGLPDYHARRELHGRAATLPGDALSIFVDAASTVQIWARTTQLSDGVMAYREASRDPEAAPPTRVFDLALEAGGEVFAESSLHSDGAEAARQGLLLRLRRGRSRLPKDLSPRPDRVTGQLLQDLVERSRAPDSLRRVWRALEGLRLLDPACGSGGWLLGCLDALTAVGASCLERMRVWVDEQGRSPKRARPEKLSDFRSLLDRSDDLAREGGENRFVTEMILLRCLHGIEGDPSAAASCRLRLGSRLELSAPGSRQGSLDAVFTDVRTGVIVGGISSIDELAALSLASPALAAAARSVAVEAEALSRAEDQLARMRLREGGSAEDLAEGRSAIDLRRVELTRSLARHLPLAIVESTLHPWIEYHRILRSGGFDLVRGHPASPRGCGD